MRLPIYFIARRFAQIAVIICVAMGIAMER